MPIRNLEIINNNNIILYNIMLLLFISICFKDRIYKISDTSID